MTRGLVTDSTARLTAADIAQLTESGGVSVRVVDLTVRVGDEERLDSQWEPAHVCAAMRAGQVASTSMPAVSAFSHAFDDLIASGVDDIVVLCMSGALSGTVGAARQAAKHCAVPVRVVDTATVSAGMVGALRQAARCAQVPLDTAAEVVATWCAQSTRVAFIPESLEFLRAGGRIGAAAALLGKTLSIVPLLTLKDGEVTTYAKVRTRGKARAKLVDFVAQAVDAVTHSDATQPVEIVFLQSQDGSDADAEALNELRFTVENSPKLAHLVDRAHIETRVISTVITAHVGPGTVGVVVQTRPGG